MKHLLILLAAVMALSAPAQAACYADYKAKQDNPLRLHYGVAQLPDEACTKPAAARVLTPRLQAAGWHLLTILSTFGEDGLAERKASAGPYYLRY
ncbi:hypothetical protein BFP70_18110 [Thioclava sp. SK-1]|uniref:hypothetical protein n=1 Tax=Thioclava sp. SK-1 TaxID=1889770 RepID=UPI0008248141|nr:hypothetical protein [Thioclava sp. SK-1]OCX59869.1 hypothetical protein BFP70_18110 [Thioclava sp. SK-1]